MKTEHPILFAGRLVRAILAGRKTQTRRLMPQPRGSHLGYMMLPDKPGVALLNGPDYPDTADDEVRCPFGSRGHTLWVREKWAWNPADPRRAIFAADNPNYSGAWRPSIFMPRSISRITLKVVSVRAEQLQDITEGDAKAEGAAERIAPGGDLAGAFEDCDVPIGYRAHFRDGWDDINGKRGAWETNPWVWVVKFRRVS